MQVHMGACFVGTKRSWEYPRANCLTFAFALADRILVLQGGFGFAFAFASFALVVVRAHGRKMPHFLANVALLLEFRAVLLKVAIGTAAKTFFPWVAAFSTFVSFAYTFNSSSFALRFQQLAEIFEKDLKGHRRWGGPVVRCKQLVSC